VLLLHDPTPDAPGWGCLKKLGLRPGSARLETTRLSSYEAGTQQSELYRR
jgi:hypothetical protein